LPNNWEEAAVKPLSIAGLLLIIAGIAGLILGRFSYTTTEKVLEVGPLVATAEEEHAINIPDVAAFAAIAAGVVLVFVGRRRA
jgi:hypothetical protein